MLEVWQTYISKIVEITNRGDAREESYYSSLANLIELFSQSIKKSEIRVTILPKKTDAGNPDFRVWDGKQKIIGYVEAKVPTQDLDIIEKTEQIIRYKTTFSNFILTNFLEFRFFRNGVRLETIVISHIDDIIGRSKPEIKNIENLQALFEKFFSFTFPSINSAQPLALELAKRTRFLRDEVIAEELREGTSADKGGILGFYEAFKKYLIRGLTEEQFADIYSQTITYGLFTSRMRCEGDFNRKLAVYDIPHSIGILREIFEFISLGDLPQQLEWIVDDISNVLANVNVKAIFSEFYKYRKGEDPVFPFYETFLAEYDPEERSRRGVYYTPKPVVSYIVRSLDEILKDKFLLEDGLANNNVTILDPAAGTLTFLLEAIKNAMTEFTLKYGEGTKQGFIEEHIMKNFYAFELMIAPYSVGHLKISFLLNELGYEAGNESLKFYLTNTLELEDISQTSLPGMASLAQESKKAGEVKKKIPIIAILGNPPYSGLSANKGKWITDLIKDYRYVDGQPLEEKNPKWLQDDYVKFIRFAQWKITKLPKGVVGYITNHSYLDNPTFRGMRNNLMKSFDEIYVLNLHGNALKREKSGDGSKDENVFDIKQGVSISFFIKNRAKKNSERTCKVYSCDVWGLREKKYDWLDAHVLKTTDWTELHPHSPFYLFVPRDETNSEIYDDFWKITDIFPTNSVGIVSARDKFVIDFDETALRSRIEVFRNPAITDSLIESTFSLGNKSYWQLNLSRKKLIGDKEWNKHFLKINYRPFDTRNIFYHPELIERSRWKVMQHMLHNNLGILWTRPMSPKFVFSVLVSENIIDQCVVGNKTAGAGISYIAPLYIYNGAKKLNINADLLKTLYKFYGDDIKKYPEKIFFYIYAVLYSNIFREKYSGFLKNDFPRAPLTSNYGVFNQMSEIGERLVDLHLLKSDLLKQSFVKFEGKGDNVISKVTCIENDSKVQINETQYFEGIKQQIWEYQIADIKYYANGLTIEREGKFR